MYRIFIISYLFWNMAFALFAQDAIYALDKKYVSDQFIQRLDLHSMEYSYESAEQIAVRNTLDRNIHKHLTRIDTIEDYMERNRLRTGIYDELTMTIMSHVQPFKDKLKLDIAEIIQEIIDSRILYLIDKLEIDLLLPKADCIYVESSRDLTDLLLKTLEDMDRGRIRAAIEKVYKNRQYGMERALFEFDFIDAN